MSIDALARQALLGSERAAPVPAEGLLAADLQALTLSDDPARTLLRQAALCAVVERAAWTPLAAPPPMPACAPETLPSIAEPSVILLLQVQAREDSALLAECLHLIVEHGRRVDERLLPALLSELRDPALRAQVIASGGAAAQWLVQLNPDWGVPRREGVEAWTEGTLEQRVAWLRAERARAPEAARDALLAVYADEPPAARAALLQALTVGLSMADEALLEQALDDRRKEVRSVAQALLRRLPDSAFARRARALVEPLLSFKPGGLLRRDSLEVALPEAATPAMQRDGIEAKPPAGYSGGQRSYWLEELLARVPPAPLCRAWSRDPAALLKLAHKHEYADQLQRGWMRAAVSYGERDWMLEGLASGVLSRGGELARELAQAIAALADAEAIVTSQLQRFPEQMHDELLHALPRPWSLALSHAIAGWLQPRWIALARKDRDYALHGTLKLAAHALHPRTPIDEDGWRVGGELQWPRILSEFFGTLSLRRQFLHTLSPESP